MQRLNMAYTQWVPEGGKEDTFKRSTPWQALRYLLCA